MPSFAAIIIRARDEMPHAQRMLDMLLRQKGGPYALFAVDSGSADGTYEALQQAVPPENLHRISPESYAPGRVINEAAAQADHDLIVLLNADAVPRSDDFLEILLRPLRTGEADAVFARQVPRPDARFIVSYDYQRAYRPERMAPGFFSAAACAFRRSLWEVHPFRSEGYAEDLAWARDCLAAGARILFVPEAVAEHSHNYTLKALYRKRFRQALTFAERPNLFRQTAACLREVARDLLHACVRLQLQTVPYNIAYRIVIHAAIHRGLKAGRAAAPISR